MTDDNDLPDWVLTIPIDVPLYLLECYHFLNVLNSVGGNRMKTARQLEICIRSVRNKIRELTAMGFYVPPSTLGGTRSNPCLEIPGAVKD
jgi:hypothetical protein